MDVDDFKVWIKANQKGLIVGIFAGFFISRILK